MPSPADILAGVHPLLIEKLTKIWAEMAAEGNPMRPYQGVRTVEQQQKLYAQGRTRVGKIVTNCDGVNVKSNHQVKADGFGHAVDSLFTETGFNGPWERFGAKVEAAGLIWGGRFKIGDLDHAELPESGIKIAGSPAESTQT